MPNQQRQSSIATGTTGSISIHINHSQPSIDLPSGFGEDPQKERPLLRPAVSNLFEHTQNTRASLAERFPRLTFLAIAIALLASVLTAEFDYLRGAGYYWLR